MINFLSEKFHFEKKLVRTNAKHSDSKMDVRSDQLRALVEESGGFVSTHHLQSLIEDPLMLEMARQTLDPENLGKIPFQKETNAK